MKLGLQSMQLAPDAEQGHASCAQSAHRLTWSWSLSPPLHAADGLQAGLHACQGHDGKHLPSAGRILMLSKMQPYPGMLRLLSGQYKKELPQQARSGPNPKPRIPTRNP